MTRELFFKNSPYFLKFFPNVSILYIRNINNLYTMKEINTNGLNIVCSKYSVIGIKDAIYRLKDAIKTVMAM